MENFVSNFPNIAWEISNIALKICKTKFPILNNFHRQTGHSLMRQYTDEKKTIIWWGGTLYREETQKFSLVHIFKEYF